MQKVLRFEDKMFTLFVPEYTRGVIQIEYKVEEREGIHFETLQPCTGLAFSIGWGNKDVWSRDAEYLPDHLKPLAELTERWHLNDLLAGTRVQREFVDAYFKENPYEYHRDVSHYDICVRELTKAGLNPDPETGYKYGHRWLFEPMPKEAFLEFGKYLPRLVTFIEGYTPSL
jgi:hypothetical protein